MTLWGAKRCKCAIPDCPDGDKVFECIGGVGGGLGSGLGHLEREHNIVGKNGKDALIILDIEEIRCPNCGIIIGEDFRTSDRIQFNCDCRCHISILREESKVDNGGS